MALLDRTGRRDQAFEELMLAVRFEPGHREAWLELVDRLIGAGDFGQGAWALEHAATATASEAERAATWDRLASVLAGHLNDEARAATYALRAETLRVALDREAARARSTHPSSDAAAAPTAPRTRRPRGRRAPRSRG